ncbi:DNA-binding transcriptional MocR family regulator [Crossiella equi]|uniref:DNA-binding transcriptional MocR family regulator n=3 Tax=Crossiella equi TaxID=130796 RepID=A0ABS5A8P9_9PSEU|nr:PLP-dependent aminotransferase family protein [Crossiella equi]MBP2472954.1 DNA-binding transcriptional MocR family regulator [Crossiella equi]
MEPIPWSVDRLVAQLGRWSAGRGSLYLLLAGRLRELIDSGQLPPRATLPPDRVLATRLAVGRSTVVAAYDRLRQERKLDRHQGRGTWVAPAVLSGVPGGRAPRANPLFVNYLEPLDDVLPLACAAPCGPPPELAVAYQHALTRLPGTDSDDIGYHPLGHPDLRTALAEHHTRRGLPTEPGQILVTTGGQQALALLTQLFLGPGAQVLVQTPAYPGALELFRDAAALLRPVPTGPDGLDVAAWTRAVATDRPDLAYLNPTHHNPTGGTVPALARRRLAETAAEHGVPVVEDDILAGLSLDGAPEPPSLAASAPPGTVVSVGSFSKVVWGGMRIGWIRAAPGHIAQLARIKSIHDLGSAAVEQLAAAALVPRLPGIAARRSAELKARHDLLCGLLAEHLPRWRFRPAGGGQCLWVRLPQGEASAYAQVALRHGVAVLPGDALSVAGEGARHLRIPFTGPPERITESVRRLAAAWRVYRREGHEPAAVHAMVV